MMKKFISPILDRVIHTPRTLFRRSRKIIHDRENFLELIALERDRVHRDHRQFSLILVHTGEQDHPDAGIGDLVNTIAERVRRIDQVGWYDDVRLGVLLPNTPQAGAQIIAKDISNGHARVVETLSYP